MVALCGRSGPDGSIGEGLGPLGCGDKALPVSPPTVTSAEEPDCARGHSRALARFEGA